MSQTVEQKAVQLVKTAGNAIEAANEIVEEAQSQKAAAVSYIDEIVALVKSAGLLDNPADEATIRTQLQDHGQTAEILRNVLTHVGKEASAPSPEFGTAVETQPSKQAAARKGSDLAMLRLLDQ